MIYPDSTGLVVPRRSNKTGSWGLFLEMICFRIDEDTATEKVSKSMRAQNRILLARNVMMTQTRSWYHKKAKWHKMWFESHDAARDNVRFHLAALMDLGFRNHMGKRQVLTAALHGSPMRIELNRNDVKKLDAHEVPTGLATAAVNAKKKCEMFNVSDPDDWSRLQYFDYAHSPVFYSADEICEFPATYMDYGRVF